MKKFALIMIIGALALSSFTACDDLGGNENSGTGNKESSTESSTDNGTDGSKDLVSDVISAVVDGANFTVLSNTLKAMVSAGETMDKSADDLYNDTGIAPESYKKYFWFSEISGLSSECVGVFEATDSASLESIKGYLETYRQSTENQMKDYNAENYEMATKAVIKTVGNYVYIVISPNVTAVSLAIDAALA